MNNLNWLIILFLFCYTSCEKKEKSKEFTLNQVKGYDNLDSLKSRIIKYGDVKAYNNLQIIYMDGFSDYKDLLYYDLLMANKYENIKAIEEVVRHLIYFEEYINFKELKKMDKNSKYLIIYYLKFGIEKGSFICSENLIYAYENKIDDNLLNELYNDKSLLNMARKNIKDAE